MTIGDFVATIVAAYDEDTARAVAAMWRRQAHAWGWGGEGL